MNELPFSEADEFVTSIGYQNNWFAEEEGEEFDTPKHVVSVGGCGCCSRAMNARTLTAEQIEALADEVYKALEFLQRLKVARFNLRLRERD